MPTRKASARWDGSLKDGKGTFKGEGGAISGQYNFGSRFENGVGSNPEELLAAAEAACFSMALSGDLGKARAVPVSIETDAECTVEPKQEGGGFRISRIHLISTVVATGIDDAKFQEVAKGTLAGCPVSAAFHGNVELTLDATLKSS